MPPQTINGILTQTQATDLNLATSVKQWLYNNIVVPYNSDAVSAGLNQGAQLQPDGTWKTDSNGLGLLEWLPDDRSIYERVPIIAYALDTRDSRVPKSTGMGDGANYEYRSVSLICLPAVSFSSDGVVQANRQAQWLLKSYIHNAIMRAKFMPIVDHSQAKVGGNYPQVGYAQIENQSIHGMEKLGEALDANRLRFDVLFDIYWAISSTN